MEKKKHAKKKAGKKDQYESKIHGFNVKISATDSMEKLFIEGKLVKFRKTAAGYLLNANLYLEPQKKLVDAVEMYLQTQPR